MTILRDYQDEFVHEVRVQYRNGHKAILLVAATGAGKTVVFSYIAKNAAAKGKRILILAHRDTLIKQASRKLHDNAVKHGIIMAGFTPNPRQLVQVASVQTLVRRLKQMKARGEQFDMIIVDEAHLSAAKSYMDIFAAWPDALVLGVTGSPIRLDGKGLGRAWGCVYDHMVTGITIKALIEGGYLVKPSVFASRTLIDLSGVKTKGNDYEPDSLAELMDKPVITGSAITAWRTICPGVPAVAWCVNVAHAQHVAAEFNAAGIPAVTLQGESTTEERDAALRGLEDGSIKIITFAMLLVEGVDCPAIGCVILLRPTMSLSSYLQVVGRGLRTIYALGMPLDTVAERFAAIDAGPKGRKCFVLDHAGMFRKHGFADADRDWDLEGVNKKKGKKKDDEPKLDISQCEKCWHVYDPKERPKGEEHICPACGHVHKLRVRKIDEVDGELAEITPEMEEAMKAQRKNEVKGAKTLAELERIGAQRGYSPGWAAHTHAARQKVREKFTKSPPVRAGVPKDIEITIDVMAHDGDWDGIDELYGEASKASPEVKAYAAKVLLKRPVDAEF